MTKYLLSTGYSTDSVEKYILDLFRVYLITNIGDIPNSSIGFNFTFTNVRKDELLVMIKSKLTGLINVFAKKFPNHKIDIESLDLINESLVKLTVNVNKIKDTYEISTGLY